MTVTNLRKDPETLTMTVTSEFAAPIDRVWQMWANPRLLERWWGPPMYPATFVDHDLTPGARATYFMTGPEGDTHWGYWEILAVEPPRSLEVRDGFAHEGGVANPEMPTTMMRVSLTEADGVTTMDIHSTFPSLEVMEQMAEMGMEEGIQQALGQIDALLAAEVTSG